MKKFGIMMLALALILAGCNKTNKPDRIATTGSDTLNSPDSRFLTETQLQEQINLEIRNALMLANNERVTDAIEIIGATENAVKHILDSNYTAATDNLEFAIGKATVLTAARPDLSFFPLDVAITVHDLVADPEALSGIRREADQLTDRGYLQAARHLLKDMASEIEIKVPMLPVATYPVALTDAAKALNNNKPDQALILLNTALSTIFIETMYVPLPLIRAERMLTEVSTLLEEEEREMDIKTLLENAEYQIRFAEALGYGKRDREFEDLYAAIKDLQKELKKEKLGDSVNMILNLREKLKLFKERISLSANKNN